LTTFEKIVKSVATGQGLRFDFSRKVVKSDSQRRVGKRPFVYPPVIYYYG